ncbi:hypothetical protein [Sphingomonas crocodyli]|uniref:Uncharacterized protein n=1 Tax=Sphingomonas crocodyli TaxID=1979270 RepID=A0A437LY71_9SPHN|nr:hypothetical protein [Sphingomonas crocodyli]RVT90379.1 hypothetical protein EOD43_19130 [Sphingomonas crocodyli]
MSSFEAQRILSDPVSVSVADGYVLVDHPCGVALTLTASAAIQTAVRLRTAALEAEASSEPGTDRSD